MIASLPVREWWTAAELAEAGLPDMPAARRSVARMADEAGWTQNPACARRRVGRGGGWEFHVSLLPARAQAKLKAEVAIQPTTKAGPCGREEAWAQYDRLPEATKAKARMRLSTIQSVETLILGGQTKDRAIKIVAEIEDVSPRTLWSWLEMVANVRPDDRLAYLVPQHRLAVRETAPAACDETAWAHFCADYLRPERPSLARAYSRTERYARANGLAWPSEKTIARRLEKDIPHATRVLTRDGLDALKKLYPPQRRDKSMLHAMSCVNGDGHKWDVFVRWPDGTVGRPMMVAFQDVYSGRLLSWRVDQSENMLSVMLAFGDMVEEWGIPDDIILDNGRAWAGKTISGGAPTRYRFKVKEDDPLGVMPMLGIKIHWATPYHGQAKPIERAFRDLCDNVAKDPRFAGAYVGNRPDAKPENYGERAIPIDEFERVVAEGIAEHNTRRGRRSDICNGRSFVEAFDESYARAPIRRATEEQRRLWLMGVEVVTPRRDNGSLAFQGNVYWAEWLPALAGTKVTVRYDPADLHAGVHVYRADGTFLGRAGCEEKVGFLSMADAANHAKWNRERIRGEKAARDAILKMTVAEVARLQDSLPPLDGGKRPEPRVVRGVFRRGGAAPAVAPSPTIEADQDQVFDAWARGVTALYPTPE